MSFNPKRIWGKNHLEAFVCDISKLLQQEDYILGSDYAHYVKSLILQ